jgi:predicted nuclease of predicted toxin-antitoxin system
MRLKLDENLGPSVVSLLTSVGHDVSTVPEERLSGATDEVVQRAAFAEGRALVTLDLDFSNPLRFPTAGTPGIVVVRAPRPQFALIIATLKSALPLISEENLRGRLWIVEPGRIREYAASDGDE